MALLKARWLAGETDLEIVGPDGTEELVEGLLDVHEYMDGRIDLSIRELGPGSESVAGYDVEAVETVHSMQGLAYRFETDDAIFTFSGDGEATEAVAELAEGSAVLAHDCSFPDGIDVDNHPTPTQLTLTTTQQNQTAVTVNGRLTTTTGTALPDRPVELSVGDGTPVIVRTDEDGRINATLSIPAGVDPSSLPFVSKQLTVTGQYAASGANLQSITQTATLAYTPPLSQSLRRTGYAGFAVLVLSGAVVAWRRRAANTGALGSDGSTTTSPDSAITADGSTDLSPSALLERARTAQTDGRTTAAVRLSYVALRHEYVDTFDLNPALTHWELYRALDTELDPSAHEFLYELTAAYERATYTEQPELLPDSDIETMLPRLEEQID